MLTNSGDCHSQAEAKQIELETLTSTFKGVPFPEPWASLRLQYGLGDSASER